MAKATRTTLFSIASTDGTIDVSVDTELYKRLLSSATTNGSEAPPEEDPPKKKRAPKRKSRKKKKTSAELLAECKEIANRLVDNDDTEGLKTALKTVGARTVSTCPEEKLEDLVLALQSVDELQALEDKEAALAEEEEDSLV